MKQGIGGNGAKENIFEAQEGWGENSQRESRPEMDRQQDQAEHQATQYPNGQKDKELTKPDIRGPSQQTSAAKAGERLVQLGVGSKGTTHKAGTRGNLTPPGAAGRAEGFVGRGFSRDIKKLCR